MYKSVALILLMATQAAFGQVKPGQIPPPELGRARNGELVSLADKKGIVQAVTFWASWCGPCQLELPMLEKLQRALGPDRLRVIAVNIEDRADFRVATRLMSDWSVVLTNDPNKTAYAAYLGDGIPYLTIVGKDGVVRSVFRGYNEGELRKVVGAVADAVNE